jgi:crotonobetaine/carnitine-CoA ligase
VTTTAPASSGAGPSAGRWRSLEHRTITGLLDARCEERPDQACLVVRDETITYAELRARSNAAAGALYELGLRPGETLAIYANTHPSWIYALLGAAPCPPPCVPAAATWPWWRTP